MKRSDLPRLDLLRSFEAAARLLSFTRAADELALTQSAVSRQVQLLEEGLGSKVLANPMHEYTQRLIASLPVPDPREQAQRRKLIERLNGS